MVSSSDYQSRSNVAGPYLRLTEWKQGSDAFYGKKLPSKNPFDCHIKVVETLTIQLSIFTGQSEQQFLDSIFQFISFSRYFFPARESRS